MKNFLLRWWRILNDKCIYCGGETWDWDTRKSYCLICGKRQ
jgi:hypothetical protein